MNKRIIKVKKIKEKKTIPLKEGIRKISVINFNKFYDKYLQDCPDSPSELINKLNGSVLYLYYNFKYSIVDTDEEKAELLTKILNSFDYNTYIDIFINTGYDKLKRLNCLKSISTNMKRLYEVLDWLITVYGQEINLNGLTLLDIRSSITNWLSDDSISKILKDRIYVIKDGVIIKTAEKTLEPDSEYEGSIIMLEVSPNKFTSIPYTYYKKLYSIEEVQVSVIVSQIPYSDSISDDPYEERIDLHEILRKIHNIQDILDISDWLNNMVTIFNNIAAYGIDQYLELTKEDYKVKYKNGSVMKMTSKEFINTFLPFLL